jgi:hypothetical protein
MTLKDFREWVASRKKAGLKIDVETCESGSWYTWLGDPYSEGLDPPEEFQCAQKEKFVRSPESEGWVSERDLPEASRRALDKRFRRKRDDETEEMPF